METVNFNVKIIIELHNIFYIPPIVDAVYILYIIYQY